MKQKIFLMLTLLIWSAASMNAQVNIGSTDDPQPGAILDLSQGSQKLGLILPNVPLATVGAWQLAGTGVEGTVVYNTNENLLDAAGSKIGKGIFVWIGNGWQAAKSGAGSPLALGFNLTPATDVVPAFVGGTIEFTASDFLPAGAAPGVNWVIPSGSASIAAIQSSTVTTCIVEGLSVGQATLAVTSLDGNVEKLVTIDVQEVTVTGFDLDKDVLNLEAGGATGTVTASAFTFSDGQSHPAPAVSWVTNGDVKGSLENKQDDTYTVTPGNAAASWTVEASAGGITKPVFTVNVTCPTATAPLTSAAGTDAQSVFKETAITNITYDLTNVVASGAAVTGLPDGVSAVQNGNTLTISGTVSASAGVQAYNYTVKLKNVCGTETDGATGSINVTPVTLASFALSGAPLNLTNDAAGTVTANTFVGTDGQPFPGSVTVTWTETGDTGGNTVTKGGTTYEVNPDGSSATWTVVASADGIDQPPFSVSVIAWPAALLLSNAAKNYSGTGDDNPAEGWAGATNEALSGTSYSSWKTGGTAPANEKNLMVSQNVYAGTAASPISVQSTTAGPDKLTATADLSSLSAGITWAEAAKLCATSEEGGYTDWYLPNSMEIDALYNANLLGWSNISSRTYVSYWSSTEGSATYAWNRYFYSGSTNTSSYGKTNDSNTILTWVARCVRRTN
ncbi:hypothetical protein FACS189440_21600 [Bacteroidia bacterium]|nr:hypothetical protein FACS189440_21600 [Bacteroidia bacterium]